MVSRLLAARAPALGLVILPLVLLLGTACREAADGDHGAGVPSAHASAGHTAGHTAGQTAGAVGAELGDRVHAAAPDALAPVEYGYALPVCDAGASQSPIDILTREAAPGVHEITIDYRPTQDCVCNLGHTVQVNYAPGCRVHFEGSDYELLQFHFHTPSEHRVNGMTFPLEMHVVHRKIEEAAEVPRYLVIGVLFACGETNDFLAQVLENVSLEVGGRTDMSSVPLDLAEFMGSAWKDFFHYSGSLTTPPFTETVEWIVLEQVFEIGPEQVAYLNRIEGNNARHVQALAGRKVDSQNGSGF